MTARFFLYIVLLQKCAAEKKPYAKIICNLQALYLASYLLELNAESSRSR